MNIQQLTSFAPKYDVRPFPMRALFLSAAVLLVVYLLIEPIRPIFAKDSVLLSLFSGKYSTQDTLKPTYRSSEFAEEVGIASWYGKRFHGRKTANGEYYNMHDFTAAHPRYAFGTILRVTNIETGKDVIVRVNDRGPFRRGRKLDLSFAAAQEIGLELHAVRIEKLVDADDVEYVASSQIDSTIYQQESTELRTYTSEIMVQSPNLRTAYQAWKGYAERGLKTSLRLVNSESEQEFEVATVKIKARKGKPSVMKTLTKVSKQPCFFAVNVHFRTRQELIAAR